MWTFIQDQLLGMKWLNDLVEQFLTMIGVEVSSQIGGKFTFFYLRCD